ncbi:hypothetical protein B0O80DRAFT_176900 [Mortierella sp. GBAus27b]|nr:hypothetical protein B0O80DRAFT_176900 [Mortierella sp. GBAus27b]
MTGPATMNLGTHSPISAHLPGSSNDLGKATKSYATKAGNGSGLYLASPNSPLSASSTSVGTPATPGSATHQISLQGGGGTHSSTRQGDSSLGSASAESKALSQSALDDHDRFGLFGMLGVVRGADQDSNMLTLGRDLTSLGLSLNSAEPLYGAFASPWFDGQSSADTEAEFHVPACYNVQPPPPPQAKLSSVLDETLFFMFYSMPRDALQDAAAVELYNRHWRYHKELRLWLMKDQSSEQSKTPTFERGTYIFFDPNSWEKVKKDFIVMYDALEERRQSSIHPNGSTAGNAHPMGTSIANGAGSLSNASTLVNGLDGGLHADLLSSLNSKQTGAVASNLMGSSLHGPHAQTFQQQRQQQ